MSLPRMGFGLGGLLLLESSCCRNFQEWRYNKVLVLIDYLRVLNGEGQLAWGTGRLSL